MAPLLNRHKFDIHLGFALDDESGKWRQKVILHKSGFLKYYPLKNGLNQLGNFATASF